MNNCCITLNPDPASILGEKTIVLCAGLALAQNCKKILNIITFNCYFQFMTFSGVFNLQILKSLKVLIFLLSS